MWRQIYNYTLHYISLEQILKQKAFQGTTDPRVDAYVSMKSTHSNTFSKWQKTNKQNRERVDRTQKGFKEGFRKLQG